MDMHEILEYVKAKQISIARFGDEEIDLMTGHSIPYQDYDEELAGRLKQIARVSLRASKVIREKPSEKPD